MQRVTPNIVDAFVPVEQVLREVFIMDLLHGLGDRDTLPWRFNWLQGGQGQMDVQEYAGVGIVGEDTVRVACKHPKSA